MNNGTFTPKIQENVSKAWGPLLPPGSWSSEWSDALNSAIENKEKTAAAQSSSEPPSDEDATPLIRARCASKWSGDYSMQKYCQDKQFEALRKLRSRRMQGALAEIRTSCAEKWGDDYSMRDYCEEKQLKALRELGY